MEGNKRRGAQILLRLSYAIWIELGVEKTGKAKYLQVARGGLKLIGDFAEKQVISSFSTDKLDEVPNPSTSRRQSALLHPESYFQKLRLP